MGHDCFICSRLSLNQSLQAPQQHASLPCFPMCLRETPVQGALSAGSLPLAQAPCPGLAPLRRGSLLKARGEFLKGV